MGALVISNMRRWRTTRIMLLSLGFLLLCCLQVTQSAPPGPFSTEDDRSFGGFSDDDGNSAEVHPFFVAPGTNREVHSRSPTVGVAKSMSAHSHFQIRRDSLETPDLHSRETSSEIGFMGRSHPMVGKSFSSQRMSFGISDDDFDNDSHENDDDDDDDLPYFGLGRRYHPEGYNYAAPKKLFIPPPATPPPQGTAKQLTQSFSNPFMYSVDTSDEDHDDHDDHFDDDDDDDVKLYATNSIINMRHDSTHEHRLAFNEDTLRGHYNFVDGQGSKRWAYELDDQYQDHTVFNDGTMKGKYGWTAPGGHDVNIQYVADEGGFRVISSHGVYLNDDDSVEEARRHHLLAHKKAGSIIGSSGDDVTLYATGGGGVPLPGFGGSGQGSGFGGSGQGSGFGGSGQGSGFGGTSGGSGGNSFSGQPGFGAGGGVALPGLETGGHKPDGAGLSPGLSGFGGSDDVTFFMNNGGGVPLPGGGGAPSQGSGVGFQGSPNGASGGAGTFGVPLPDPGTGEASAGGSLFGDDETTFVLGGNTGGVSLPGGSFGGSGGLDFGTNGGSGNFGLQLITENDSF